MENEYYEAKGLGFRNCNVVLASGEVCGLPIANTEYDMADHMRKAHPFRYHDETCDSDADLCWLWDWIDPDDPPIDGDDGVDTSVMILLCNKCYVMVTFTTIRPGNLQIVYR